VRVLLLDAELEVEDAVYAEFSSTHSLFDYDLVLWDPLRSVLSYDEPHYMAGSRSYQGRRWLSEHDSAQIQRDAERRANDIGEFLLLGRTLVVFVPGDLTVKVETGEKRYSGTGRNQKTTTILADFDIWNVLPIDVTRTFASGVDMEPVDSGIGPLYRETADYWQYGAILSTDAPSRPLLRVTGTTKPVAAHVKYDGGGNIILLPMLLRTDTAEDDDDVYEDDEDVDVLEDLDDGGGGSDDEHVVARESDPEEASPDAVVDDLVLQWIVGRVTTGEVDWPAWVDEYRFQSELNRAPTIENLKAQAAAIQAQLDALLAEQEGDHNWKVLVTSGGTPLEVAVARALEVLGFELQPVVPGRTDVRGIRGGRAVVVETKGLSKSAAEGHSAQLEKWVAEEVVEERAPKGILVINAFKQRPPLERTDPVYPPQMRPYAERRDHCLVSGVQLLNLARTALAQPERVDELANLLLNTTGVLEGWDHLSEVFGEMPAPPTGPRRQRKKIGEGSDS